AITATSRQREAAAASARLACFEADAAFAAVGGAQAAEKPDAGKAARERAQTAEKALVAAEAALKQPASTAYVPRSTAVYPANSSGRRLALAGWLVAPENPLTARVAVNQIWMRHFGQGLVPTVENFGRQGQAPTNPQLLDWLALAFAAGGAMEYGSNGVLRSGHRSAITPL